MLGDRERDADEREDEARDECDGGGVAHAERRRWAAHRILGGTGWKFHPRQGERAQWVGEFTVSSPERHGSSTQSPGTAAHGAGGPSGAGGCSRTWGDPQVRVAARGPQSANVVGLHDQTELYLAARARDRRRVAIGPIPSAPAL